MRFQLLLIFAKYIVQSKPQWNFEYLPLSLENEQDAAAQLENETLGSEEGDEQKDSGESETHDTFVL